MGGDLGKYHSMPDCVSDYVGSPYGSLEEFAQFLEGEGMTGIEIVDGNVLFVDPYEKEDDD